MLKNIIIAVLTFLIVIFWLKEEPEDTISNDPNDVVIEYKCSDLREYESIPPEVLQECKARGLLKNSI